MADIKTVPQLFAIAIGDDLRLGSHHCFFCGASCNETHTAKQWVKDTFTGLSDVARPGSPHVCHGCTLCMDERGSVPLACGEHRTEQKRRMYSWVITSTGVTAATKAHRDWLRKTCCNPPPPPFAICITDSGQRQLLYRGVVNPGRDRVTATLEGERITYWPGDLVAMIELAVWLIGVVGKPAMQEGLSFGQQMLIGERLGVDALDQWLECCGSPLSRLAVWLSPGKDEAINERAGITTQNAAHPAATAHTGHGPVSSATGKTGR